MLGNKDKLYVTVFTLRSLVEAAGTQTKKSQYNIKRAIVEP